MSNTIDVVMMFRKIDGTVVFYNCADNSSEALESENIIEHLERAAKRKLETDPRYAGAVRIDDCKITDLPHRKFRKCWRDDGSGKVHVDIPLAREQRMAEIRAERNTLLDASDKEKARIDDVGTAEQKTAISAYRQALRDLPAVINLDAIDTPEALDVFEPTWPVMEKL